MDSYRQTDQEDAHGSALTSQHSTGIPGTIDSYPPVEIARRVEKQGLAKARTDTLTLFVLAVLAGAFISLGAMAYVVVVTDSTLGFGLTRLVGGLSFSLGLILVVVAGAELFTGNNLIAMAWASRLISTRDVLRNWIIVYTGNVFGCLGTVLITLWSNIADLGDGAVGETAILVASNKSGLSAGEAFARGVLCNALVCLAVWLAMSGRNVTDKILAIVFPITAFVVIGLEHSIANWFLLPLGWLLDANNAITVSGVISNIVAVTAGNIFGGTLLVAGVYWVAYLRPERLPRDQVPQEKAD